MSNGLIVDSFAGGGGASLGIEMALGRHVDIAINHNAAAIAMHRANHPFTKHYIEDIWAVDPIQATQGKPVQLAWFSPDCRHFSKAKGGKPVSKRIRGLAWVVIRWAAKVRPSVIILENVEEFTTWGPLTDDNMPCPERKGQTFRAWKNALINLGYKVEHRELRACDYGAPTIRKRFFLIARCDGLPIVWPEPTHGEGLLPYRTAAECIDWSIPCPSIFERPRPLADNTLRRIARGIVRYVIEDPNPFIVRICQTGSDAGKVKPVDDPLTTITSKNEHCLCSPMLSKYHGQKGEESRATRPDEPLKTQDTSNRFALVAANLIRHYGQSVGQKPDSPAPTTTAGGGGKTGIVAAHLVKHFGVVTGTSLNNTPFPTITSRGTQNQVVTSNLVKLRGTCRDGQSMNIPMPTITAGGQHIAEVRAFLIKYYGQGIGQNVNDPLHSVTTKDRFGIVVTVHGEDYVLSDIGMRMLTPRELYRAQGFPDTYNIDRCFEEAPDGTLPFFTGRKLTKTDQIRMCGNSVPPDVVTALVKANVSAEVLEEQAV